MIDTRTTPPKSLHLGGSSVCSVYLWKYSVKSMYFQRARALAKVRSLPIFYQTNVTNYPKNYSMEISAEAN